jgi:hypothetical protein
MYMGRRPADIQSDCVSSLGGQSRGRPEAASGITPPWRSAQTLTMGLLSALMLRQTEGLDDRQRIKSLMEA